MRSPEQQKEFLEHGRFCEGEQTLKRAKTDQLVWIGLLFFAAAGAIPGSAVVFKIGRDDGGPLFVMGSIVASAVGAALCVWGLIRMRRR